MAADARMLVGHCRWATQGDPSNNLNNHPHPADGGWIVHNGQLRNYAELVGGIGLHPVSDVRQRGARPAGEQGKGSVLERCRGAVRLASATRPRGQGTLLPPAAAGAAGAVAPARPAGGGAAGQPAASGRRRRGATWPAWRTACRARSTLEGPHGPAVHAEGGASCRGLAATRSAKMLSLRVTAEQERTLEAMARALGLPAARPRSCARRSTTGWRTPRRQRRPRRRTKGGVRGAARRRRRRGRRACRPRPRRR